MATLKGCVSRECYLEFEMTTSEVFLNRYCIHKSCYRLFAPPHALTMFSSGVGLLQQDNATTHHMRVSWNCLLHSPDSNAILQYISSLSSFPTFRSYTLFSNLLHWVALVLHSINKYPDIYNLHSWIELTISWKVTVN